MRVSLINMNLVAKDATGQSMLHQLRFHQRRGDEVRIYVMHPPEGIPADLSGVVRVVDLIDLMGRQDEFFQTSDLYVYHYPGRYALLDTIKTLDRGAVIFYYHNVTPPELWARRTAAPSLSRAKLPWPYILLWPISSLPTAHTMPKNYKRCIAFHRGRSVYCRWPSR